MVLSQEAEEKFKKAVDDLGLLTTDNTLLLKIFELGYECGIKDTCELF